MPSPSGSAETPCVSCGKRFAGLPWGERCPDCRAARMRRANRLASRISLAGTALMAAYLSLDLPADTGSRLYAGVLVAATYLILRRIVQKLGYELLKD